jgi:hypothetical protein
MPYAKIPARGVAQDLGRHRALGIRDQRGDAVQMIEPLAEILERTDLARLRKRFSHPGAIG